MVFVFVLIGWVISLCLHEFAHARVAYAGGDTSVAAKGYLSLNPLRYTEPVYSLLLPLLFLALGGIGLPGGAVYIETHRLRGRGWQSAVSLAGPAANLAVAAVIGLALRLVPPSESALAPALAFLGLLQVSAVVLNLLPLPPLDGFGIIEPFLPHAVQEKARGAGRWALWGVFILLWSPAGALFWWVVFELARLLGVPEELAMEGYRAFQFWRRR